MIFPCYLLFLVTTVTASNLGPYKRPKCFNEENEEFSRYAADPACDITCSIYHQNAQRQYCLLKFFSRCVCKKTYIRRSSDGKCVLPESCDEAIAKQCDPRYEEFTSCKADCPRTCDNYDRINIPCARMCVKGCICRPPLVRDTSSNKCIKPWQCPAIRRD